MFTTRGNASALTASHPQPLFANIGLNALLNNNETTTISASVKPPGPTWFASIGFGNLFRNTAIPSSIKEPRTGILFDGEYCFTKGKRNCPRITGAGARTKKIAGIKSIDIYALSMYVDEAAARGALRRRYALHQNSNKDSDGTILQVIARDPQLFKALDAVEKTLVLVITSGLVKRKQFLDALNERLAPPLAKGKEGAALDAFKRQFGSVAFRKGLEIAFHFDKSGKTVTTKADGKVLQTIGNATLTKTLLDIYVGSDPVSPQAKKDFGIGLARMALLTSE